MPPQPALLYTAVVNANRQMQQPYDHTLMTRSMNFTESHENFLNAATNSKNGMNPSKARIPNS
jgi:hypothetical protein